MSVRTDNDFAFGSRPGELMKMIIGLGVLTAAVAVLYGHVLNTTRIRCACKGCSG